MIDLPKENTRIYKICTNFLKSGLITMEDYIEKYGLTGNVNEHRLMSEVNDLISGGCLRNVGNKYMPTMLLANSIKMEGVEYVQPKTAKPFRPMDSQHHLPKLSPRGQEIRNVSFIRMGSNVPATQEGVSPLHILNEVLQGLQA